MSSNLLEALKNLRKNLHNVGSLNNWGHDVINQGAKVIDANIDNFCLVTLGFSTEGERTAKALDNMATKTPYMVATPEDYMEGYETISSFFNAVGERARIVKLETGRRFECSNVDFEDKDLATNPLKNGQVVHYNATSKKFIISNKTSSGMGDYGTAGNKFVLVDKDCVAVDGIQVYRFEVA